MKLNKAEASLIQGLMRERGWDILTRVLAEYVDGLRAPVTGNSAFEELRALHKQQGAIEGLQDFFSALESKASEV